MTDDAINQSGQGSAAECRLRPAPEKCFSARCYAALIPRFRLVRTSGVSVPRRSAKARSTSRSVRGYGADHAQAPGGNGTSAAGLREKQWANYRGDRDTRVGRVPKHSEKAWLSGARDTASFKFTLTMRLIACTIRSSLRPTVFWCPVGSVPSAAL